MNKQLKIGIVIFSAIAISTIGIQASDLLQGAPSSLTGNLSNSQGPCNTGEELVIISGQSLCVDIFEASPADSCPVTTIQSVVDVVENVTDQSCGTVSESGREPWRYVSFTDAQQLCARDGKRLLTNQEWYKLVSGTDMSSCATDENAVAVTGSNNCVSPLGIHDQVGNVWEWVEATVNDGVYKDRTLPRDGYITLVDEDGVVLETSEEPQSTFGEDYAWTEGGGVTGMIRGGFYGSQSDAGIFALNAAIPLNAQSAGVGFRCVRDIF